MNFKYFALASSAGVAIAVTSACLTGCSRHGMEPPHVKTGENLVYWPAESSPAVYVRGSNIVVAAPQYSYRSVFVVLNPNNAMATMGDAGKDEAIAPSHTGYVGVVRGLSKGATATIPITRFHDNRGHPFPVSTHISEVGILFNGGPDSDPIRFGPTDPD